MTDNMQEVNKTASLLLDMMQAAIEEVQKSGVKLLNLDVMTAGLYLVAGAARNEPRVTKELFLKDVMAAAGEIWDDVVAEGSAG